MAFLRRAFLAGLLAAAGCQSNTIDLAEGGGTGADDSGSGSGGQDDARPTTSMTMTTGIDDGGGGGAITEGWWLMAIDTPLAPGLPFQFLVQVLAGDGGVFNLVVQPLSLDQGSTTSPRQPVGDSVTAWGVPLGDGAPLQFYTGVFAIPGAANPITGTDVTIDIYVDGMQIGDPFCGAVSGNVVSPVSTSLTGATFATTRLTATDPASLPTDFPLACP